MDLAGIDSGVSMELSSLAIAVALFCSLPAGLLLIGVLAHRPSSGAWLRKHARAFAWFAAIGWGGVSLRHWFVPGEFSTLAVIASIGAMLCMAAFAVLHPSRSSAGS